MAGVDMVHIPFQGGTAPLLALMNGQVDLGFDSIVQALPHVKTGRLRVLAITSAKRSLAAPEVLTIAEAGLPGFEVAPWFGVAVPAGTPRNIVGKLNSEINAIIQSADVKERLSRLGVETFRYHSGAIRRASQGGKYEVGEGSQGRRRARRLTRQHTHKVDL